MDFDAVVLALPGFDARQLEQIRQRSLVLLRSKEGVDKRNNPLLFFYEILTSELALSDVTSVPFVVLKKQSYYQEFKTKAYVVLDYCDKNFPDLLKIERNKIYRGIVRLVIRYLKDMRVPISVGSVTRHLHRVPELVERAFPGYLAAGMLEFIIRDPTKTESLLRYRDERRKHLLRE